MRAFHFLLHVMAVTAAVSHLSLPLSVIRSRPHLQLKDLCVFSQPQRLRGAGNSMGTDGDAITEEQAGEELIKAASNNNVDSLDPPGIEILVSSGAPVNYQVSKTIASVICTHSPVQNYASYETADGHAPGPRRKMLILATGYVETYAPSLCCS